MDVQCECMDWITLTQATVELQILFNAVVNLQIPFNHVIS